MPKISIPQRQMTLEVESGTNLMSALLQANLPVASSCHGDGICSMCRVRLSGSVNSPADFEINSLKRNKCEPNERLSCQVTVASDLVVQTRYW